MVKYQKDSFCQWIQNLYLFKKNIFDAHSFLKLIDENSYVYSSTVHTALVYLFKHSSDDVFRYFMEVITRGVIPNPTNLIETNVVFDHMKIKGRDEAENEGYRNIKRRTHSLIKDTLSQYMITFKEEEKKLLIPSFLNSFLAIILNDELSTRMYKFAVEFNLDEELRRYIFDRHNHIELPSDCTEMQRTEFLMKSESQRDSALWAMKQNLPMLAREVGSYVSHLDFNIGNDWKDYLKILVHDLAPILQGKDRFDVMYERIGYYQGGYNGLKEAINLRMEIFDAIKDSVAPAKWTERLPDFTQKITERGTYWKERGYLVDNLIEHYVKSHKPKSESMFDYLTIHKNEIITNIKGVINQNKGKIKDFLNQKGAYDVDKEEFNQKVEEKSGNDKKSFSERVLETMNQGKLTR
jgi:hypothetical protein